MKVVCDFCHTAAYGSQIELVMKDWSRVIFRAPFRKTITTCPNCHEPFLVAVETALVEGKKKRKGAIGGESGW